MTDKSDVTTQIDYKITGKVVNSINVRPNFAWGYCPNKDCENYVENRYRYCMMCGTKLIWVKQQPLTK